MNYLIEANAGFAFLYLVYVLTLARENEFGKQRIVLLGIVVCALVFPLITITAPSDSVVLETIMLPELRVSAAPSSIDVILTGYIMVTCLVALPFLFHAASLYRISRRGYRNGAYWIVESDKPLPSWSFFKVIYIGRAHDLDTESRELIIKHEVLHGRLLHSADILVVTLLCIICWFNPFVWLLRRTLAKVHEFEVDDIIARENGATDYSMLLAKTALSDNGFLLTHHFNQSFILKRINMINTIKNKISNWKIAVLGVAMVLVFIAVACTEPSAEVVTEKTSPDKALPESGEVFTEVDQTAIPAQGIQEFYNEIANNLVYPEQARKAGVEGKVFVEFIVNQDGHLSDFKVLKGIGAGCDAAALKVITEAKNWNPGIKAGVAVRQKMVLPINFKLD